MSSRGAVRRALLVGAALLVAGAVVATSVVVVGATVLAVRPAEPRDRPVELLLPADGRPLRVTVLGTSLSSPTRYSWPDQVAARLDHELRRPVEVTRITRAGATSAWGADQAGPVLDSAPDVVLVELAVNDADVTESLSLRSSEERHAALLEELAAARPAPRVVLLTMNPASGARGWTRPFLSRYYAQYADLAARFGTGLVDLYPRWLAVPPSERGLIDGLHPSDAAANRVLVDPVVHALVTAARR